jgi:formate hydrogenlyase subunit 3/multisubunit Na+/H+ antiporter MnhD subunit
MMPLATLFSPVLILLLGVLLLPAARRLPSARSATVLCWVVAACFLLSCLLVLWLQPITSTTALWRPGSLFDVELGYYADDLSALCLSLIAMVTLIAVVLGRASWETDGNSPGGHGVLFLVAAGASSVFLSADLVTLCLSWAFLDLALLVFAGSMRDGKAGSRSGLRSLVVNYLGGVALLAALLVLQGQGESLWLQAGPLPTRVISLVMVGALMRLGLYPAFIRPPSGVEGRLGDVILWYAVPVSVGGYLLARVLSLTAVSWLPGREVALILGSLAVILSPFPLWFETGLRKSATYIVLHQVGHMAMAAAIAAPYSTIIITVQAGGLVLALTLFLVSEAGSRVAMRRPYALWTRCCLLIAVAALAAAPLTLGFVSRQLLYASLGESRLGCLIVLSLVSNSFLAAPLLKKGLEPARESESEGHGAPVVLAGMTALAIPIIVLGLHPPFLGHLMGSQSLLAAWPSLPELVYSPDRHVSLPLFVGTLVSLTAAYLMCRKGQFIVARTGISLETLRAIAEMEWFFGALAWTVQRLAVILETVGGFFEERRSSGWILVFATLAALLLLSS